LATGDLAVHDEEAYPQETLLAGTTARPAAPEPGAAQQAAAPESLPTSSS
jgi:hypothetical protein